MLSQEGWFTTLIDCHSIIGGGKPAFLTEHLNGQVIARDLQAELET